MSTDNVTLPCHQITIFHRNVQYHLLRRFLHDHTVRPFFWQYMIYVLTVQDRHRTTVTYYRWVSSNCLFVYRMYTQQHAPVLGNRALINSSTGGLLCFSDERSFRKGTNIIKCVYLQLTSRWGIQGTYEGEAYIAMRTVISLQTVIIIMLRFMKFQTWQQHVLRTEFINPLSYLKRH